MRDRRTGPAEDVPDSTDVDAGAVGKRTRVQAMLRSAPRLQAKAKPEEAAAPDGNDAVHAAAAAGTRGAGGALPHQDKIQESFGRHDVGGVKAHVGGEAAGAADAIGAEAFAAGDHVAFRQAPDLHTAAHEAAHTVQQQQGVQLAGGVGQAGDAYEQHADAVADAVVAGKSAEALLDGGPGGGAAAGGVQKLVQREATAKSGGNQQLHLGTAPAEANAGAGAVTDPFHHPYWPTFKARVGAMFSAIDTPDGSEATIVARQLWSGVCSSMQGAQAGMQQTGVYQGGDRNRGWVDMKSDQFETILTGFDGVMGQLRGATSSQFATAKSFGFWSAGAGKQLAEAMCDITLETSAVGALFDGMPSLDGVYKGGIAGLNNWDPQLWAALSRAYATSVGQELKRKGKKAHVCVGPYARAGNIFDLIESVAIGKQIEGVGKKLSDVTEFHAAATSADKNCDFSIHKGTFDGTAWSGTDLPSARDQATLYYEQNHAQPPVARMAKDAAAPADPGAAFAAATSGGGSEVPYRREMEGAFGQDFGNVQAHVGQASAMDSLGAHAAASGESVAFGSASPDKHTVAHELTHVVQHRQGAAGVHGSGGLTSASDSSEVEADRVASAVVAGERVQVAGGASDGIQLARKPWAERKVDLLAAIDARLVQMAQPAAAAQPGAAQPPAAAPPGAAPPGAAPPPAVVAPVAAVAPDPAIVTTAELGTLRTAVEAATDDASMDAATARGVTLFSTKAPPERERFDGWVRAFGGVDGAARMDTFLQLTDGQAASVMADTSVGGLAQQMLMRTFESNWFKAKECLVFWRWPGDEPVFSRATGLELMTALTRLRGAVHTEASRLTQGAINAEVAATAERQRATNPRLAATLTAEAAAPTAPRPPGAPPPPPAVEFKGSVGADTVTSDVDVSTGGVNTEIAVRVYNEQFRTLMQTAFDPGTVFDLNVYSKDFIFKPDLDVGGPAEHATITPGVEHPDAEPSPDQIKAQDAEQDIAALVHIARYMTNRAEWDGYAARVLAGITNAAERDRQEDLLDEAWGRVTIFNTRLSMMMDTLKTVVDAGIAALGPSSWEGDEAKHFDDGAVRMRAANRIYEQELMKVKDLRAQIEACTPEESEKKGRLAAELTGAISSAQLYANEVYGSRGGTVHAVIAVQVARKKAKELGKAVDVDMPPALWNETFNDNLGDVLKDYQHYGHASGEHAADYGYAAFKMGKYADRMIDAVPHLGEGGGAAYLGAPELAIITASPQYTALVELSREHVTAKNGPASNNPALLAANPYFAAFDAARLALYKDHAITLGADVRGKVAQHRAAAPPDGGAAPAEGAEVAPLDAAEQPPAEQPAAPDGGAPPGPDPRPILGATAGRVRELIARAEAASKDGPGKS